LFKKTQYAVLLCALLSTPVYAETKVVDRKKLWLPTSYQYHYHQLEIAAEKVAKEPDCFTILSGTVLESVSTIDHPVFNFRCRTKERRSFAIQVDGKTLKLTHSLKVRQEKLVQEALNAQEKAKNDPKILEARRLEQARYWGICLKELKKKTRLFKGVKVLTELPAKPDIIEDKEFIYTVDFDALSSRNATLKFRTQCIIEGLDIYKVSLMPRKGQ